MLLGFIALLLAASAVDRAIADIDAGRLQEAEGALRAILKTEPASQTAHYHLGIVLFRRGLLDEAAGPLTRATELNGKDTRALSALGVVYAARGLYEEAYEPFRKACGLNPRLPDACYYAGRAAYALNRFEASIEFLQKALPVDSRPARVHAGMAQAYEALGNGERAEGSFRAAIKSNDALLKDRKLRPDDDPRIAYSVFLFRQGRLPEAESASAAAVADNPASAKAGLQHARVLYQTGRVDAAAEQLEKALKLHPNLAPAHLLLGKAYARLGKPEESRRHLGTAEKLGLQ
jgi:tetratricopeptide (TPR) repeat protein